MDDRDIERFHYYNVSSCNCISDIISNVPPFRKLRILCQSILKNVKKLLIPFGVVSASFLLSSFNKVHAETFNKGIIPILLEEKQDLKPIDNVKQTLEVATDIFSFFAIIKNYLKETSIAEFSVDILTKLYEIFMLVLKTPLFIFNNSYLTDATLTFSMISILLVTILTMIEGFKRKLKKTHTSLKDISRRWAIAVVGSGVSPYVFEKTFQFLNMVTEAIAKIGSHKIQSNELVTHALLNQFHVLTLVAFDLIILALMIPLFLQNGRRFFDLMCLSSITPLALSAWIFDDHKHYFNTWWRNIKKLSLVQLVYATFVCLMGLFIFGTQNTLEGGGLILKMLTVVGGLMALANPPNFVKNKLDNGDDILQYGRNVKKTAINVAETVTLKKFNPLYQGKKKLIGKIANKLNKNKEE